MVSRNPEIAWHHSEMEEHAQYKTRFGCNLPGGVHCADLGGEVGALVVDEREKRGDHGEDCKKANES